MSFVLDTNVVLYHLSNRLAEDLPDGPLCISIITEMELLSFPGLSEEEEEEVQRLLKSINIIDLSEPIKNEAIQLRRAFKLKLPDAIILATAKNLSAPLITNDVELSKVEGIEVKTINLSA